MLVPYIPNVGTLILLMWRPSRSTKVSVHQLPCYFVIFLIGGSSTDIDQRPQWHYSTIIYAQSCDLSPVLVMARKTRMGILTLEILTAHHNDSCKGANTTSIIRLRWAVLPLADEHCSGDVRNPICSGENYPNIIYYSFIVSFVYSEMW